MKNPKQTIDENRLYTEVTSEQQKLFLAVWIYQKPTMTET